ncbi:MAG TPA: hypothetical protein VLA62_10965, partial [Solirubrobacterales bacterium]|nr:hypothetical protein [Solirubrobacterales bacterium]
MFTTRLMGGLLALAVATTTVTPGTALAASAAEIDRNVDAVLIKLYAAVPKARELEARAKGILVFPRIYKAGFMFGAQYGEGALRRQGRTTGYYSTVAASYGLQVGVQAFGYALFFMTDSALEYLDRSGGFELGTGPSIAILDAG